MDDYITVSSVFEIKISTTPIQNNICCDFCGSHNITKGYQYVVNLRGTIWSNSDCICPACVEKLKTSDQELKAMNFTKEDRFQLQESLLSELQEIEHHLNQFLSFEASFDPKVWKAEFNALSRQQQEEYIRLSNRLKEIISTTTAEDYKPIKPRLCYTCHKYIAGKGTIFFKCPKCQCTVHRQEILPLNPDAVPTSTISCPKCKKIMKTSTVVDSYLYTIK